MQIRQATLEDLEDIVALWKDNRQSIGIPWRKNISSIINKGTFYIIRGDDDTLIGMGCYQVMPIKQEIWVLAIAISAEYRRCGFGTQMLNHLLDEVNSNVRVSYPLYISYVVGDDNNDFYNQFNNSWNYVCDNEYKSITTVVYQIPTKIKGFELF